MSGDPYRSPGLVRSADEDRLRTIFACELGDDEQLLWLGQPPQGIRLRGNVATSIFLVLWTGCFVFWELMAAHAGSWIFGAVGAPFIAVGLVMSALAPVSDARQRARTLYALPDRRAIIIDEGRQRRVTELFIIDFNLELEEHADGTGTIVLDRFMEGTGTGRHEVVRAFERIDDASAVFAQLRTLKPASSGALPARHAPPKLPTTGRADD